MLKIKEIRKEKNYTQKDLANFLNKSITTICDWERGRTEPSTDDLIQLAKIFKCSVDYLLGIENEEGALIINTNLNNDENYLINILRQLNNEKKQELISYANYLVNKDNKQINSKNTIDISDLSDIERAEVLGFISGFKKESFTHNHNINKSIKVGK